MRASIRSRTVCLVAVALTSFLLGGCVRYYRTADVRARLVQSQRELDQAVEKVVADLRQKEEACGRRGLESGEPGALLATMRAKLAEISQEKVRFVQLQRDFDTLAQGKRRIRSDSPEWEPLQAIKDQAEALSDTVKASGDAYAAATNRLAQILAGP